MQFNPVVGSGDGWVGQTLLNKQSAVSQALPSQGGTPTKGWEGRRPGWVKRERDATKAIAATAAQEAATQADTYGYVVGHPLRL